MQHDVAELAGLVLEACLYGVFFVLTVLTLHSLVRRRRGATLNIIASFLMFGLATAQLVIDTRIIFDAFIPFDRAQRNVRLLQWTLPAGLAKRAIFLTMMILGDVIAIHRCYVIWMRNWKLIILPSFCAFVSAAFSYSIIWAGRHMSNPASSSILSRMRIWTLVVILMSLVSNTLSTSLVAYRIWRIDSQARKALTDLVSTSQLDSASSRAHSSPPRSSSRQSLLPIARIVVESGILNTVYLLAYLIVGEIEGGGKGTIPIIIDMATPLVGIIFSLVIVRSGAYSQGSHSETTGGSTTQLESIRFERRKPALRTLGDSSTFDGETYHHTFDITKSRGLEEKGLQEQV